MKTGDARGAVDSDPTRCIFHVDDEVFCVLGYDVDDVQDSFMRRIDPEFFAATTETLARRFRHRRSRKHVAMLIRLSYLHALETALAMTFALVQAPAAMPAWLRLYRMDDLEALARKVGERRPVKSAWNRVVASWSDIAGIVLNFMPDPLVAASGLEMSRATCIAGFAESLGLMSTEFLDKSTRDEYNDLKHGFRVSAGGFRFAVQSESASGGPGTSRPASVLADAEFGSTSIGVERIQGHKHLLRYAELGRSWDPEQILRRMQIVSAWIGCVKAGLESASCGGLAKCTWSWFADPVAYREPWVSNQPMRAMEWRVGSFEFTHAPSRSDLSDEHRRRIEELRSRRVGNGT
jgi:hypothetical protein